MDQLRPNARLVFIVLFIGQVFGVPTFYWSQPDCSQPSSDYESYDAGADQSPNYQGSSYQGSNYQEPNYQNVGYQGYVYQGPNYQQTLQTMIEETLKAVSEIVQIAAKTTKQELAELSKILYGTNSAECNSVNEPGESQFNGSPEQTLQQPENPSEMDLNNAAEPQSQSMNSTSTLEASTEINSETSTFSKPSEEHNVVTNEASTPTYSSGLSDGGSLISSPEGDEPVTDSISSGDPSVEDKLGVGLATDAPGVDETDDALHFPTEDTTIEVLSGSTPVENIVHDSTEVSSNPGIDLHTTLSEMSTSYVTEEYTTSGGNPDTPSKPQRKPKL